MSLKHKMILLGDSQVGKTSLILKYIKNEFNFNTTITMSPKSFYEKEIRIKNNKIDLVIWDTVGQDKFKQITKINIKGAKMVLLIFDLTNIESFKNLDNWYNLVKDILDVNKLADIIMIDLNRPSMQPLNNIVTNLVYAGRKDNIKMTMINGKILYEDGKFYLNESVEDIYKEAMKATERLENAYRK